MKYGLPHVPESLVGPLPEGMPLLRYRGFFDGGARSNGAATQGAAGAGAVFFDRDKVLFSARLPLGRETNSVAENRASVLLLRGILRVEEDLEPNEEIGIYGDNTTSVRNLNGEVAVVTRHENRVSAAAATTLVTELRLLRTVRPGHLTDTPTGS